MSLLARILRPLLCTTLLAAAALAAPEPQGDLFGHFVGKLPCADCPGIHVDLMLYSGPATYVLKQTYEGKRAGNSTYTEQGTWLIGRGSAANSKAVVYELDPTGSHARQFYLRDGKNTLRALDAQRKELPSHLPHTLKRTR